MKYITERIGKFILTENVLLGELQDYESLGKI